MKKYNYKSKKGFTILEGIVIFIIGAIVLTAAVNTYVNFLKLDRFQKRVLTVDRSLLGVQTSLKQDLTTFPGRGLATSYGLSFATPILPAAGSMPDSTGKNTPIKLGIITPYKINGEDAFTVVYADAKIPRMVLAEPITVSGNIGTAKIALPSGTPPKIIVPPNPKTGSTSTSSGIANINKGEDIPGTVFQKGTPSPSPSPSSSPSPSPNPTSTKDPSPSPSATPVPPDIPYTQTLFNLPWIPSADLIKPGDLMLLVNAPLPVFKKALTPPNPSTGAVDTASRIVKILSVTGGVPSSTTTNLNRQFLQVTFDMCLNNDCEQLSGGLFNPPDAPTVFSLGSILVPMRVVSYFWKGDQMSYRIVKRDGGLILPDGSNGFKVVGGKEDIVGESDTLTVTYRLKDGSTQPTPNSPLVPWLKDIISVDVKISREVPSLQGDPVSRKLTFSYPLVIRNLE